MEKKVIVCGFAFFLSKKIRPIYKKSLKSRQRAQRDLNRHKYFRNMCSGNYNIIDNVRYVDIENVEYVRNRRLFLESWNLVKHSFDLNDWVNSYHQFFKPVFSKILENATFPVYLDFIEHLAAYPNVRLCFALLFWQAEAKEQALKIYNDEQELTRISHKFSVNHL